MLIVAGQVVMFLFKPLGLRLIITFSTTIMMISALFIIFLQQKWISYADREDEVLLLNYSIPLGLIFLSMSCQVGYCSI